MATSNHEDHNSTDQTETITFLSQAENLSSKKPPERIDTHGAIIFLTEDRVFKLKRAVNYGYLDFSTIEKRGKVCAAELRLNRRTAPDLYLEVRSITKEQDGTIAFQGEGQTIDWVVVMQRFPDQNLFAAIADRKGLTPKLMRDLADHIAEFHNNADIHKNIDGVSKARTVIDGNLKSMEAVDSEVLPPRAIAQLHEKSIAEIENISGLLQQRAEQECIRHCHGDLHLGNICLWQDQPTLFDCLEFNDELATTDVLYDLAFLLMDLWQRNLRPLGSLVFNRYLDIRPESGGIATLPLFISMRASVRSHVSAAAATQQASKSAAATKQKSAQDYLSAAISFLEKSTPELIAIGGLSGTGKSTLAAGLAPEIGHAPGARWLRTDVLRKRMLGVMPETRLGSDAYTPEQNKAVYHRLLEEALSVLSAGHSVVLDGVFANPDERKSLATIAKTANVRFRGLWLEAPASLLYERVTHRKHDASDANKRVVEQQLDYRVGNLDGWNRIDAGGTPHSVLDKGLSLISNKE